MITKNRLFTGGFSSCYIMEMNFVYFVENNHNNFG